LAVTRVAGTRERARAERADVQPPPRVGESPPVALGHLDVGEQVVAEQDGLGRLGVGRAGQDGGALPLGQADEGSLEAEQARIETVDRTAGPEAKIRRDLVVPRAAGVELAGDRADPLGERSLEVQVDVLEPGIPAQLARLHVAPEIGEPRDEGVDLGRAQDAGAAQAADMGDRAVEVVEGQLGVHLDRAPEGGDVGIGVTCEPTAPQPHPRSSLPRSGAGRAPWCQSCRDPTRSSGTIPARRRPATCNRVAGNRVPGDEPRRPADGVGLLP
jgi:hypothetical protein